MRKSDGENMAPFNKAKKITRALPFVTIVCGLPGPTLFVSFSANNSTRPTTIYNKYSFFI